MPSSQHYHISKIMDLIININPMSILDIGTGFGKYGVLCREYLELWDGRHNYSQFLRALMEWKFLEIILLLCISLCTITYTLMI